MAVPMTAPSGAPSGSLGMYVWDVQSNVDEVMLLLEAATSPLGLQPWMQGFVVNYLQAEIKERFQSEGDRASGKWAPLEDATENIRQALGFSPAHPINIRTGQLHKFVTTSSDTVVMGDSVVTQVPGDSGDSVLEKKLETAQKGSRSNPFPGARNTPARPVLALDTDDAAAVLTSLQLHIVHAMEGRFGVAAAL